VVVTRAPDSTGGRDIWIFDTSGKDRGLRLSFEGDHSTPVWSADERAIYYTVESEGVRRIVTKRADGSGAEQELHRSESSLWPNSQSPRAPLLVVEGGDAQSGYRLWLLPLEGERRLRPFQQVSSGSQAHAAFSPDGSLLAYTSDENGVPQVFVQPVEGSGVRWQVSSDGGDLALWRADGKELYYVGLDRVLRAVPVRSLAPFAVGVPEALFPLRVPLLAPTGNRSVYAPSRDGQRFLVNDHPRAASEPGIRIILGWRPPARPGRGTGAG
jgi:Tol biopolymer transport system component